MSLRDGQVLYKDKSGQVFRKARPDWASDPNLVLSPEDVESFNNAQLGVFPRMQFEGTKLQADVVLRGRGDVIFHFHDVRRSDFRDLLAEVVEEHFGTTDSFYFDDVPELEKTFGLLAKGVRNHPLYNQKHFIEDFLHLLDAVLIEAGK